MRSSRKQNLTSSSNDNRTSEATHRIHRSIDALLESLSSIGDGGTRYASFPQDLTNDMLSSMEEKLALATSYLRTMRNSKASICTLPPELLCHIFSFTHVPFPQFMPTSPRIRYDETQAASNAWHPSILGGVCRYWRTVTLTFPTIWTTIDIGDPARAPNANISLAMLCLRRSYASAVEIHIWDDFPSSAIPWFSETLASQSIRFKGFHIYNFDFGASLLDVFAECPAPELQSLTIQTLPQEDIANEERTTELPMIFAGITPKLRHLTVRHYTSWPGNTFTNLTHLCLEHAANRSSVRRTSDFLQFLAACPLLEELIINAAGPNDSGAVDSRTPEPRIDLPHLQKVVFKSCPVPCVARILSHIRISRTAVVQLLQCRSGSASTLLSAVAGCSNLANITRLKIESCVSSWSLYEGLEFPEIPRCIRLTGTGMSCLDIFPGADMHEVASNQYMAALVGVLSACRIEELWLGVDEVIMREALWQRILCALPMLKKLYVGHNLAGMTGNYSCLTALHVPDESSGLALPCPNLKELIFLGSTLDNGHIQQPAVQRLLQERRRRGFPVMKVEVFTANDSSRSKFSRMSFEQSLSCLGQFVPTVDVHDSSSGFPSVMEGLYELRRFGDRLF